MRINRLIQVKKAGLSLFLAAAISVPWSYSALAEHSFPEDGKKNGLYTKSDINPIKSHTLRQNSSQSQIKFAHAVARMVINAPPDKVWSCLTDFQKYPEIFKRVESCQIVKQDGDLVWLESNLKAHMFVRKSLNHTVNDLRGKPSVLNWHAIDGNFETVRGKWELAPDAKKDHCQVTYTLEVNPGPVIPPFMVAMVLKMVQREIVVELKNFVEHGSPTSTGYIDRHSDAGT